MRSIGDDQVADHELVREPKHAEPFLNFGLCGDCNRVYHIRYGNTFVYSEVISFAHNEYMKLLL